MKKHLTKKNFQTDSINVTHMEIALHFMWTIETRKLKSIVTLIYVRASLLHMIIVFFHLRSKWASMIVNWDAAPVPYIW